jgi:hypothetical protein
MSENIISQGSHMARGIKIQDIIAKTGTPGVVVTFRILDEGPFQNWEIDWRGWTSPGMKERTVESLEICGYDGENDATISTNVVQIVIHHEQWKNETTGASGVKAEVRWVNDPNRGRMKYTAMDPAQKAQQRMSLRGELLARKEARAKGLAAVGGEKAPSFDFGANAPEPEPEKPAGGKPMF